jgi:pimeloyl-ACP methyl ester carboxylesterase
MDRKSLIDEGLRKPPPPSSRKHRSGIVGWTALAFLALFFWHRSIDLTAQLGSYSYDGETIEWQQCGKAGEHEVECGEITVPMDQFNTTNSGDKTFSIPVIRMRAENATKNLIFNPGGPGGSGLEFMYKRGEQLRTVIGNGFHIVSFDPRGVNMSRPLAACYPDDDARTRLSPIREANVMENSAEVYAWTSNFVRSCADTMGDHGKYIDTPQTAADMNSILDSLGQYDMYYWGFSYGTLLGQTYATLFPERSKRVIIDGVVNQFEWYGALAETSDFIDTENVFHGFVDECIKAGKDCSLTSLASTKEELLEILSNLGKELESDQISVYLNNTVYGILDHQKLWFNGIFPTLYKPAGWHGLAERLANLLNGNATDAFLDYGLERAFAMAGDALYVVHLNDGKSGPKHWPQKRTDLLDILLPAQNKSAFLAIENKFHFMKQQWSIPQTHGYVPKKGVKTAHPLLILSTTYDPICPLDSARVARDTFEGSRLVELKGYGHCTLAMESACIAKHVRDFIYEGTLPAGDVQCEVDNKYFESPEKKQQVLEAASAHGSEEQRIRAAQLILAQEMEWPSR